MSSLTLSLKKVAFFLRYYNHDLSIERRITMKADLIIKDAFVMTMNGPGVGMIEDGAIAIKGDKIVAVGTSGEVLSRILADEIVNAK
jgi:imidazolonepropionase-like amidohydrolase